MRNGNRRIGGGKSNTCGTPQGGVTSPLLANLYMNRFLKHWRLTGRGEASVPTSSPMPTTSSSSAADCGRGSGVDEGGDDEARAALNEAKTSLKDARREHFDFLGYSFGPHRYKANGHWYLSASPSKKSVRRFKAKVGDLLVPGNKDPGPKCATAEQSLLGWSNYFCHGTCRSAFRSVDRYVYERVRDFLARRHKVAGRGTHRFSLTSSMENSVLRALNACRLRPVVCLAVKPVGEPDAGNRHVRFDERGWETGRCKGPSDRAHPQLYRHVNYCSVSECRCSA